MFDQDHKVRIATQLGDVARLIESSHVRGDLEGCLILALLSTHEIMDLLRRTPGWTLEGAGYAKDLLRGLSAERY